METVFLASTNRRTTRLGFGCGIADELSMYILDAAYDAGIRHFDVARAYGHGLSEGYLGAFLRRRNANVTVTTKYGILPPTRRSLFRIARKLLKPVAIRLRKIPAMDRAISQSISGMYAKASFTPEETRASLIFSLKQLGLDRVDVFLMHEATVGDLADDGLLRFLEDSVAHGLIGAFGVGGESARVPELYARRKAYCGVLQFDWSIFGPDIACPGSFRIHYRTFSHHIAGLHAVLAENSGLRRRWSDVVGTDLGEIGVLSGLLLKAALVFHPNSVVLFSSRDPAHIVTNVRAVENASLVPQALRFGELIAREGRELLSHRLPE